MTDKKTLSVVIACFNEVKTIDLLLQKVKSAPTLGLLKEIIIVDDGSTDGSDLILKKHTNLIKYIRHPINLGKGASIKTGVLQSTGEILLIQDADLEYNPDEYPLLIEPILSGRADVVYGSRFMGSQPHRVVYYWHALTNRFLTTFSNMFTNINLTDIETCYKAFNGNLIRKLAPKLESHRFGFEPEITARLAHIPGIRFYEVGISYYGRTYSEGKHINWVDGIKAIFEIIKFNVFR